MSVCNLFIPLRVRRRRTSFIVQLPEQQARCCRCRHIQTPNYGHTLTCSVSFFPIHIIMSTHCACAQNEALGWTVGVIDDGLRKIIAPPPPAHTHPFLLSAKSPQLLCPPGITQHHTMQLSVRHNTATQHQCPSTPLLIPDDATVSMTFEARIMSDFQSGFELMWKI